MSSVIYRFTESPHCFPEISNSKMSILFTEFTESPHRQCVLPQPAGPIGAPAIEPGIGSRSMEPAFAKFIFNERTLRQLPIDQGDTGAAHPHPHGFQQRYAIVENYAPLCWKLLKTALRFVENFPHCWKLNLLLLKTQDFCWKLYLLTVENSLLPLLKLRFALLKTLLKLIFTHSLLKVLKVCWKLVESFLAL